MPLSDLQYYVDIVICIDKTGGMHFINDRIKESLDSIYSGVEYAVMKKNCTIGQLRIKIIAFGDFGVDEKPIMVSDFYRYSDEKEYIERFLDDIKIGGGGDCPEDGLEAFALALKSDWTTEGDRRRHVVMIFSNSPVNELGKNSDTPQYPDGMPADTEQLFGWWEETDCTLNSTFQPKAGRLIACIPEFDSWKRLESLSRSMTYYVPDYELLAGDEFFDKFDYVFSAII